MLNDKVYPSIDRVREVTDFKSFEHASAAIETLRWLDSGAPHKFDGIPGKHFFDMKRFIAPKYTDDEVSEPCGTACCIAGAIVLYKERHFGSRLSFDIQKEFKIQSHDDRYPLTRLFFPKKEGLVTGKTSEQAVYTLRKYLFTGEVEWKADE